MKTAEQLLNEFFPTGEVFNLLTEGKPVLDPLGASTGTYQHTVPVYLPDGTGLNARIIVRDGVVVSAEPYCM